MAKSKSAAKKILRSCPIKGRSKIVKAGDCVLMRAQDPEKPPYIARVESIKIGSKKKVKVRWYYRPEDSIGGRRQFHGVKELFLSDHCDLESVDTIEGECTVHSLKNYRKLESLGSEDYFCRFEYKATTGGFTPDWFAVHMYCKCKMPYNPDKLMVQCESCKDWFHPACLNMTTDQLKTIEHFICPDCFETKALKDAFAPLNDEEEEVVSRALKGRNSEENLGKHGNSNIEITGKILQCLLPSGLLNDEVINLYLELLKEREKREPNKFLKCHFFNTFFYKKVYNPNTNYDYKAVREWTTQKKIGYSLMDCEKIFVPIHKEEHWCLAIIDMKAKKLQYLDSLKGRDAQGRDALRVLDRYITDEAKDKNGQDLDLTSWEKELVDDLPQQENGSDCGMFMIKYADFHSRGLPLSFYQTDMPYFRKRTAKEIIRLKAE